MSKLTDRQIRERLPPETGYTITYDDGMPGFGVRITAAGVRSFVIR